VDNDEQVEVRRRTAGRERMVERRERELLERLQEYDEDGDGIGEIPYTSESLFESLIDAKPELRIFGFSPVAKAIELASRAFP
jgi:nitrous oxidase accessory protein NosD